MNCFCCCKYNLADAAYCIEADPFDGKRFGYGIRPNPEGIKLLESEDGHIDASESRQSYVIIKN